MTKRNLLFFGITLGLAAVLLLLQNRLNANTGVIHLSSGWDVTVAGAETVHNADVSFIEDAPAQSLVSMSHLLPNLTDADGNPATLPAMIIESRMSGISVSLDGEVLYEAFTEQAVRGEEIDERPHFVDLPADYAGKLLTITLYPVSGNALLSFPAPGAGDYPDILRFYNHRVLVTFCAGIFMLLFGLISLLLMTVFFIRLRKIEMRMAAALLTADAGLFLMLSTRLQTHVLTGAFGPLMQSARFLFLPLLFAYLLMIKRRIPKKIFLLLAVLSGGGGVLMALLHVVSAVSAQSMMLLYLVLLLASSAYLFYESFVTLFVDREFSENSMQLLSVAALCMPLLFETVACVLQAMAGFSRTGMLRYLMPLPCALYFTSQLMHDCLFLRDSGIKREENETLYKVAYEDALTELGNRTAWDEKIHEVDASGTNWCIISMDLDGLKGINDTKGHAAGDKLISGFARVLEEAFGKKYSLFRIGGDEFCVIMEEVEEAEVKKYLDKLEARLQAWDRREKNVTHHCSYGYAFYTPGGKDAHTVYMDADMIMYEMKSRHKAAKKAIAMTKEDSADVKVAQMVEQTLAAMREEELMQGKTDGTSPTQALMEMAKRSFLDGAKGNTGTTVTSGGTAVKEKKQELKVDASKLRTPLSARRKKKVEDALKDIQDSEIQRVAKDVAVKKAMKQLEEAVRQAQQNPPKGGA